MKLIIRFFITAFLYISFSQAHAVEIVRLQLDYSGSLHTIDIELHDDIAPLTVANYLNYVDSGRYDETFIYRSISNFIIQTGGYTFKPIDPLNDPLKPVSENTGLEQVLADDPVVNEFNLSNIRGTIALAKIADDPDSGSNEWFISLADNAENLDNQNGGFTVFGTVIDDGMAIADEITAFPKHPTAGQIIASAFSDLPVVDYDLSLLPDMLRENLVMINTISSVSRPVLRFTPQDGNLGLDVAGDAIEKLVSITLINKGDEELKIDSIDTTNLLAPFSINTDTCVTNNLQPVSTHPSSSCDIVVSFSPITIDQFSSSLIINYSSTVTAATYSVSYYVSGEGVVSTPVFNINPPNINFGEVISLASSTKNFTISNIGGGAIDLSSILLSGTNADQFTISNSGCSISPPLQIEQSCEIELHFNPDSIGEKIASLDISWNSNAENISIQGVGIKPVITSPANVDLGTTQLNQMVQEIFSISNSGSGNLTINNIDISGANSTFFTQENVCPDTNNTSFTTQPLNASGSCDLRISYTPTSEGNHTALLTIQSTDPDNPEVTVNLTGKTGKAIIQAPLSFDVGTSQVNGVSSSKTITITNMGEAPLEFSEITGLDLTNFTQFNNCIGSSSILNMDETCSIFVTFNALTVGAESATLSIVTNDLINTNFNISLTAFADNDSDGILSEVEISGPNSGDGNNDDIADDVQNNVATLRLINGNYITLISDKSAPFSTDTTLADVAASALDTAIALPNDAAIENGTIGFNISLPTGSAVRVGLLLAAGKMPDAYYSYGPTLENTTPHWYNFAYDSATSLGANFIGQASLASPSGDSYSANMIIISFVDGGTGDDDMLANGVIEHRMGALTGSLVSSGDSGSGSLSYFYLIFILLIKTTIYYRLRHV